MIGVTIIKYDRTDQIYQHSLERLSDHINPPVRNCHRSPMTENRRGVTGGVHVVVVDTQLTSRRRLLGTLV